MKITDYGITPKGDEQYEEWVHAGNTLSKRDRALYNALSSIWQGTLRKESYAETLSLLPSLLKRGLIEEKTTSARIILGGIESSEVRKDLDIYHRLSKGEYVSDSDVDYLYTKSRAFVERVHKGDIGALRGLTRSEMSSIVKTVRSGKTRSSKVIAIDTTMSLVHDGGGISSMAFWDIDAEDRDAKDATEADRFFTRLFEGD